jgi:hypothetical protein
VGQRAFVTDPSGRKALVALIDVSGKATLGQLADGAEVEILAWIPRRGATLYRVQSTERKLEGWLGVANLRTSLAPSSPATPKSAATPVVWISPRAAAGAEETSADHAKKGDGSRRVKSPPRRRY